MSFYNTQTPAKFVRQNENVYSQQHIQFLRSGFQQALPVEVSGYQVVYSAFQMIANRFITRVNLGDPSADTTASAAEIIAALNNDQSIRATAQDAKPLHVQPGFHVDFCIYNEDPDFDIMVLPGNGVSIGAISDLIIPSRRLIDCRLHVTNIVEGQEEVYISVLTNLYYPVLTQSGAVPASSEKFAKPILSSCPSGCACHSKSVSSKSTNKVERDNRRKGRTAPVETSPSDQVTQQ